ncbi:MAG: hypothetical protein ACOC0E_11655 [Spirochaetota bacterium]
MKKSTITIALAALLLALATTGCDLLLGDKVTEEERLDAFVADANASTRNYEDMQSHFHSTTRERNSMNTEEYWEGTNGFSLNDRTISITDLTSGGEVGGVAGTSSLSGTITTTNLSSGAPITIGFLADETNPREMKIRLILIDGENTEEIRSVR